MPHGKEGSSHAGKRIAEVELDRALVFLTEAVKAKEPELVFLAIDPSPDALRERSDFDRLVESVGSAVLLAASRAEQTALRSRS
jgi:hypothetical protein